MDLLQYRGGWIDVPTRRPELLTQLAPESLQGFCAWNPLWPCPLWDTTLYGYPRFRLALLNSRYTISGGVSVTRRDRQGNIKATTPAEVLFPRYHVPRSYHGTYVLEMWRPAAWWYEANFAGPKAMEYDGAGKGIRNLEPVWADGDWLAIWNGIETPLVFTRDVSTELIRWALYVVHLRFKATLDQIMEMKRLEVARQDAAEENAKLEQLRSRRPTMPGPMVVVPENVN